MISCSSSTRTVRSGDVLVHVTFGESGDMRFARLLPKLITFEPPPCIWFMRKIQGDREQERKPVSSAHQALVPVPFESNLTFSASSTSGSRSATAVTGS